MTQAPTQLRQVLENGGDPELLDWLTFHDDALPGVLETLSDKAWLQAHSVACVRLIRLFPPEVWSSKEGRTLLNLMRECHALKGGGSEAFKRFMHDCESGEMEQARLWLQAGLGVLREQKSGWTALHLACATNCLEITEQLIDDGADPRAVDVKGNTPLHYLLGGSIAPIVKLLISRGAGLNQINADGQTPLHRACKGGLVDVVKTLLAVGADPNYPTGHPHPSHTPLYVLASAAKHLPSDKALATAQELLQSGAKWDAKDSGGHSILFAACQAGSFPLVDLLLKQGALVSEVEPATGNTLLHGIAAGDKASAKSDFAAIVETINKRGVPIDVANRQGLTPLHVACCHGNVSVIKALLKAGANNEITDKQGNTPLISACMGGNAVAAQLVVLEGANVRVANHAGQTPLHAACANGDVGLVETLIAQGADPLAKDLEGNIPPHEACRNGSVEVVEALLLLKLLPCQITRRGDTPYGLALQNRKLRGGRVVEKLREGDAGITFEVLSRRMLAHQFGIKGYSEIGSDLFSLDKWTIDDTKIWLQISLEQYYGALQNSLSQILSKLSPETAACINDSEQWLGFTLTKVLDAIKCCRDFQAMDANEIAEKVNKGELVAMLTGWPEHTVGAVLYGRRLCRCDCGLMPGHRSGILCNTIVMTDRWHLGIDALCHLKKADTFYRRVNDVLGISQETYIPLKTERPGDYSIANSNALEIAILYMLLEPMLGHKAAVELAFTIQAYRCGEGRDGSLATYLLEHRQGGLSADYALLAHLYELKTGSFTEDQERRKSILAFVHDSGFPSDQFLKLAHR